VSPRGRYSEAGLVEVPALELLADLGWEVVNAWHETFGPAGTLGRDSMHEVFLVHRLRDAIRVLNPAVPEFVREEALQAVVKDRSVMDRVRANREVHARLRDGYRAEWTDHRGDTQFATVRFVDFADSTRNEWLAASQVWVAGDLYRRRTDVVLFVNGIPLVLAEFKEPNRPAKAAFDENITDYRDTIPQLFIPNSFVICSNGSEAKVGATYAPWEFFGDWKVIDADGTRGVVALETAIRGTCAHDRLLDLVENFTSFIERPGGLIKVVARNHQLLGVNAAIENLWRVREAGEKRLGVFWHTQGSGKSLSMLWFTQKVLRRVPGAWTFVMVTDRAELDVQLHGEFADAGAVSPEAQVHATSAAHLRELLAADHRYVFTLIHKFRLDTAAGETTMPVLSDRSDVIVITDEAHRSQYDTLALNMRRALPNAAFMGFTGTPLMAGEELTRQQFGDYVSVYNFRDAIEDGSTVPLYYENRIPELQLINDDFSDELTALLEEAELDEDAEGQLARRFGREYTLLTRPERLRTIARDLVTHFVGRGFTGKAMYVGVDKAAAVRMYDYVQEAWADYRAELQAEHDALPELERPWLASRIALMDSTDMAVVVSQSQNEIAHLERHGLDIRPHRKRMNDEDLAERFKALLPDPAAAAHQHTVAAIRVLAERLLDLARPPAADLDTIADAVDELLDRSVGAEEYVIRAAAESSEPDPLIDLSQIDFDVLAARFAGRKRAETDRLAALLKQRAVAAAGRNPTRYDLVERIEELIAAYNASSLNIDEYLRRLVTLSKSLTEEEQRGVAEGLSEEELAIFDLLTKPDPVLTDAEREEVKASAKRLLALLHDKLVLDWRRKAATTADVRVSIRHVLDVELPADPYPPEVFDSKVQAVFDHVATAYGDDGRSVYDGTTVDAVPPGGGVGTVTMAPGPLTAAALTEEVVEKLRTDAEFVALVAEKLGLVGRPELRTVDELIANDEDYGDGFVNWLTTHLVNALGHPPVTRTRARITNAVGRDVCRVDVAASPLPVWAKTSKGDRVFFVRLNNSTRALPDSEIDTYLAQRFHEG
jgi:HsdR family type I site-specific deoxyribonuclease